MKRHPASFLVYLATCRATGKVYVGCTTKSLRERQEEHHVAAANGSPWKFHKALREHGLSSFVWGELATATDRQHMFALERQYIARYNSFRSGLNSTQGGAGSASDGARAKRKLPRPTPYPKPTRRLLLRR